MTFRRIDSYATDQPEKLADQLSRLEDNISRAFDGVPTKAKWTDWVSEGEPQAAYDEVLRLDTSVSALSATLPSIDPAKSSREVGIVVYGAFVAELLPVEDAALIDGLPSATLAVNGLYRYVQDGQNWWSL